MIAKKVRQGAAIFIAAFIILGRPTGAQADVVTDWNAKAEAIAIEKRMPPPPNARAMAILHIAMFEAVNAIERRYSPYRLNLTVEPGASKEAAAAAAAHTVLVTLHPEQEKALDANLLVSLQPIPDGQAKTSGILLGRDSGHRNPGVARRRRRKCAGKLSSIHRRGRFCPARHPGQLDLRPRHAVDDDFRIAIPAGATAAAELGELGKDVNEIRELGARANSKRSAEQTDIGRFWFVTGPQAWNPIVRQLAAIKNLDIVDSARLFALVAIATDDAFIAVFDAKYHYNFWRPITAIRNADLSNNPATPRDPAWLPLGDTPMHPEYPCAHCITSTAAASVLQSAFGNEIPDVSMTSATAPGITRRWTRLQDYADEVAMARIYAGFHYRFSNAAAQDMGRKIATRAVQTQLRALNASTAPAR